MANHASAKKRIRQTAKRTERNKRVRTATRTLVKRVRTAITAGDAKAAEEHFAAASRKIDMAVQKGVYHPKTGARYISRLARQVHALKG